MDRSIRFYVDGAGFAITNRWDVDGALRWCRLQLGGASLMLQTGQNAHAPGAIAGAGVSLCFQCEDAVAIYRDFMDRGINVSEPEVGNGMWHTGVSDPDGYRVEFHSVTDVPEDTKLSELT